MLKPTNSSAIILIIDNNISVINDRENGFIVPVDDPISLAECLFSISTSINKLQAMKALARKSVSKNYSFNKNTNVGGGGDRGGVAEGDVRRGRGKKRLRGNCERRRSKRRLR